MSTLKISNILILVLTILSSCSEDRNQDLSELDSNTIEENPDWTRERFNSSHTIMFPDSYEGGLDQEVVGTTFIKRRNDEKVIVTGGFCNAAAFPCRAVDYIGEGIENDIDSISYTNLSGNSDYLNKKITFRKDQKDISFFFYTDSSGGTFRDSHGRFFLNDLSDSTFKMAGTIEFSSLEQQEVIDIIESIKQE